MWSFQVRLAAALLAASLGAGCATGRLAEREELTLAAALESVATGLARMRDAQGDLTTGLVPAEVTVVFHVKASAERGAALVVDSAPAAGAGLPLFGGLGGEASASSAAERGNQVIVRFSNVLFAPDDVLLTAKSPGELEALLEALRRRGIQLYRLRAE